MTISSSAAPRPAAAEPAREPSETATASAPAQPPAAGLAFRFARALQQPGMDTIYLNTSDRRAEQTANALASFAPDLEVLYFPAWDCLPYDRAPPSRDIMGERMAVLQALSKPAKNRRILIAAPHAVLQRVPPRQAIAHETLQLVAGEPLDRAALETFAARTGYVFDDRIDEPGEIALRGNVIDVFPADQRVPVRITDEDGKIGAVARFDPVTQRTLDDLAEFTLRPASELIVPAEQRLPGAEHHLAAAYDRLETIFDYLPEAKLLLGDGVEDRVPVLQEQIAEAHATAQSLGDGSSPASPKSLYLDAAEWTQVCERYERFELDSSGLDSVPPLTRQRSPGRAMATFVSAQSEAGNQIVVCGTERDIKRLGSSLQRNHLEAEELPGTIVDLPKTPGIWLAPYDIAAGFVDSAARLTVIAAADVLGAIHEHQPEGAALLRASLDLRLGDVVVHEDHGVGVLEDLAHINAEGVEQDTIRLRYHDDATLMVPVQDFGKLWRYGAEVEAVKLDRLNSPAWAKKRAQVSAEIEAAARALAELAAERLAAEAQAIEPPRAAYQRFAARFPYTETPHQTAAIAAVLDDLASGYPMNRLVCGDVGFGKTEVALRAAAAVALAGRQVALVAPTTILARQHLESFERRFAGTGITIDQLSRLNTPAETEAVKSGLRDGSIRIVIATHAIAADDVIIPELGLVIVDEEQRFGARLKQQLEDLAKGVHLLFMSATPIPRTLQSAMVGLQDVSVIATPPARRRPVRTFLAPYDAAAARTALLREKRRGGQSFFVVPRIEDIEIVREELGRTVPELTIGIAHGELSPKQIDAALMDFANGAGDILLATNIIESGLDVPRANTMLIWRADRFGLSQLHQLRGRVGRGRAQGFAYLLTDPEQEIAESTRTRLATLETMDRLGSGFAIAARDLELRGAGDLLGEDQAGHVHLIGAGLYQQLLERALASVKGEPLPETTIAQLNLNLPAFIPTGYVPEAVVRINLYARLRRMRKGEEIDDFAEELEDRFGQLAPELEALLATSKLALAAGALGIERIDAGPKAIALTLGRTANGKKLQALSPTLKAKNDRLVAARSGEDDLLGEVATLLGQA